MNSCATREISAHVKDPARVRHYREKLARAAIVAFSAGSYHDTAVSSIGRIAGMTQGTIFNYVETKEDILYLACMEVLASAERHLTQVLDAEEGSDLSVESIVTQVFDGAQALRGELRMLARQFDNLDLQGQSEVTRRLGSLTQRCSLALIEAKASDGSPISSERTNELLTCKTAAVVSLVIGAIFEITDEKAKAGAINFVVRGIGRGRPDRAH